MFQQEVNSAIASESPSLISVRSAGICLDEGSDGAVARVFVSFSLLTGTTKNRDSTHEYHYKLSHASSKKASEKML
jgi:hypothetical protein